MRTQLLTLARSDDIADRRFAFREAHLLMSDIKAQRPELIYSERLCHVADTLGVQPSELTEILVCLAPAARLPDERGD